MDISLKADFDSLRDLAKNLDCCREDKLKLYGLERQAIYGPVMTVRPGMHNRKDPQEWEAWKAVEAKTKEEAMGEYTKIVKELAKAQGALAGGVSGVAGGLKNVFHT